jgi:hypothetical protein
MANGYKHNFMKGIFVPVWCAIGVSAVLAFVVPRGESSPAVAVIGFIWATLPLYQRAFWISAKVRKNDAGVAGANVLGTVTGVINVLAIIHSYQHGNAHIGFGSVAIWHDILLAAHWDTLLNETLCTLAGTGLCLPVFPRHHRGG